jgi:hypothetical protein
VRLSVGAWGMENYSWIKNVAMHQITGLMVQIIPKIGIFLDYSENLLFAQLIFDLMVQKVPFIEIF